MASTHTSDNYFKSRGSSQPRRGVHSWPAIQYCQRNLKFHPFQPPPPPPPHLSPLTLLPHFASKTLCSPAAVLTHANTTGCPHVQQPQHEPKRLQHLISGISEQQKTDKMNIPQLKRQSSEMTISEIPQKAPNSRFPIWDGSGHTGCSTGRSSIFSS